MLLLSQSSHKGWHCYCCYCQKQDFMSKHKGKVYGLLRRRIYRTEAFKSPVPRFHFILPLGTQLNIYVICILPPVSWAQLTIQNLSFEKEKAGLEDCRGIPPSPLSSVTADFPAVLSHLLSDPLGTCSMRVANSAAWLFLLHPRAQALFQTHSTQRKSPHLKQEIPALGYILEDMRGVTSTAVNGNLSKTKKGLQNLVPTCSGASHDQKRSAPCAKQCLPARGRRKRTPAHLFHPL